ncbi:unnamed protein product, partial [Mesorhabditis belari]|uniref:Serpentine receptor class gamma n=1 Tax=Mesorhabditis belari TaxID=2138241 RepID=A0AAF3EH98_9BILA
MKPRLIVKRWTLAGESLPVPKGYDPTDYDYFYSKMQYRQYYYPIFDDDPFSITFNTILFGQTSFCVNLLGFYFIYGNNRLGNAIKAHLLSDTILRSLIGLTQIYFGSCLLNEHCLGMSDWPWSGALINQIVSALYFSAQISVQLHELLITLSRLFAISFDGVYYHHFSKGIWVQVIAILLIPLIPYTPTIGSLTNVYADLWTPAGNMYDPNRHSSERYTNGSFFDSLIYSIENIVLVAFLLALFTDIVTLYKVRERMEKSESNAEQARADIRLSLQMLIIHSMNAFHWVFMRMPQMHTLFTDAVNTDEYITRFAVTLVNVSGILNILLGFLMIYLNRPIKEKENPNIKT